MRKIVFPFVKGKNTWPFKRDVEHFDDFPNRQPALLFAGIAYGPTDYITLWKTLNLDPVIPEEQKS